MAILGRHVRAAPPQAVGKAVTEFRRAPRRGNGAPEQPEFAQGFEVLFAHGQEQGELPADIDPAEMAQMLQALVMDSILDWAAGCADLGPALRRRSSLVLAGLRARLAA